jgi:hypothetical protein
MRVLCLHKYHQRSPWDGAVDAQVLIGLASSLLGGTIVALITHLSNRQRIRAEIRKLNAETDRTRAETTKLLSEVSVLRRSRPPGSSTPPGWDLYSDHPSDYDVGIDTTVAHGGAQSAFIMSRSDPRGFGTLMQTFAAERFRGTRLRVSAFAKTVDVEDWAGLWMRVDGPDEVTLAFDNMQDRPLQGTTNWRRYHIVLDVPGNSERISFGVLLEGAGHVWLDDVEFEPVRGDTATTGIRPEPLPPAPVNLDFESPP